MFGCFLGIKESMVTARNLQDDSAEMQLAIDATKKALNDLENSRRPKRDAEAEEEVDDRLQKLRSSNDRINNLMANVKSMVKTLKGRLKKGREVISAIDTGISFTQGSHLELQLPPKVEELAINTHIQLYFNVTKSAVGGRAFIFYLGNVEETHTKLPSISTDDYMAVEITEGGYVKLTMNLGKMTLKKPGVKFSQNSVKMQSKFSQNTVKIQSKYSQNSVKIQLLLECI